MIFTVYNTQGKLEEGAIDLKMPLNHLQTLENKFLNVRRKLSLSKVLKLLLKMKKYKQFWL